VHRVTKIKYFTSTFSLHGQY